MTDQENKIQENKITDLLSPLENTAQENIFASDSQAENPQSDDADARLRDREAEMAASQEKSSQAQENQNAPKANSQESPMQRDREVPQDKPIGKVRDSKERENFLVNLAKKLFGKKARDIFYNIEISDEIGSKMKKFGVKFMGSVSPAKTGTFASPTVGLNKEKEKGKEAKGL